MFFSVRDARSLGAGTTRMARASTMSAKRTLSTTRYASCALPWCCPGRPSPTLFMWFRCCSSKSALPARRRASVGAVGGRRAEERVGRRLNVDDVRFRCVGVIRVPVIRCFRCDVAQLTPSRVVCAMCEGGVRSARRGHGRPADRRARLPLQFGGASTSAAPPTRCTVRFCSGCGAWCCALTLVVVCGVRRAGRRLASTGSSAKEGAPLQEESSVGRTASNNCLSRSPAASGADAAPPHAARSPCSFAQCRRHLHHHHTTARATRVVLCPNTSIRALATHNQRHAAARGRGRRTPTEGRETKRVRCAAVVVAGECASARTTRRDAVRRRVIRFRRSTSRRATHAHIACTPQQRRTTQAH